MRASLLCAALLLLCCTIASAQAKSGSAARPTKRPKPAAVALRSECLDSVGLCISVPATWQREGDIFEGLGFVVAEPKPGADPAGWPHLTVAAIDASPQERDNNSMPSSLDELVERMLTSGGALASANVLERSSLLINGANAQIVRVGLPATAEEADAIEVVALIEGEEGLVYSVALRCSPPDFSRLQPVFQQALQSWRVESAEAAPAAPPPTPTPNPAEVQPNAAQSKAADSAKTKP